MRVLTGFAFVEYLQPQRIDGHLIALLGAEGTAPLLDLAYLVGSDPRLQVEAVQMSAVDTPGRRGHGKLGQHALEQHTFVLVCYFHVVVVIGFHESLGPLHGGPVALRIFLLDLIAELLCLLLVDEQHRAHVEVVVVLLDDLHRIAAGRHQCGHVEGLVLPFAGTGVLRRLRQRL